MLRIGQRGTPVRHLTGLPEGAAAAYPRRPYPGQQNRQSPHPQNLKNARK